MNIAKPITNPLGNDLAYGIYRENKIKPNQ